VTVSPTRWGSFTSLPYALSAVWRVRASSAPVDYEGTGVWLVVVHGVLQHDGGSSAPAFLSGAGRFSNVTWERNRARQSFTKVVQRRRQIPSEKVGGAEQAPPQRVGRKMTETWKMLGKRLCSWLA
jgi:hypothetical protein